MQPATPHPASEPDAESTSVWGFADSGFTLDDGGIVKFTGSRYALCGEPLPHLLPWVEQTMQVKLDPALAQPSAYPPAVDSPLLCAGFVAAIEEFLPADQRSVDPLVRLRHGHGHTQAEMHAIKHGRFGRVPDMVVYPDSESEVVALVQAAKAHGVCLIPYGGGTNVTEALRCADGEARSIVCVDLKRLRRILWVDRENRLACIEAGAVGRHLVDALQAHGFTLGHEPDSIEFSTLGGWIATHASGMKKNRYGNIEDIVMDMRVVTADGLLHRVGNSVAPRESIGFDPRRLMFGSEGSLGIITSAVVKLFPLPEVQAYGSVLFPDFSRSVRFLYELTQAGNLPASVRLVDNTQFQFSMALKPARQGWRKVRSALEKFVVTRLRGFDPQQMTAATLVFEGDAALVKAQEAQVYRLAKRHGGIKAGEENGRRGYALTYSIAYIRDFVMQHHVLAESFETSVPWSQAETLCERVKARLLLEHQQRGLPGKPFITCRISQLYDTGVCVYFYFGFYTRGVDQPSVVYADIEHAARQEILDAGGSLSHHHGIGKVRQPFLPQIFSTAALKWGDQAKQALDPNHLFACGNNP
jgi:alkyldihydroxyacetonephosphate synthase